MEEGRERLRVGGRRARDGPGRSMATGQARAAGASDQGLRKPRARAPLVLEPHRRGDLGVGGPGAGKAGAESSEGVPKAARLVDRGQDGTTLKASNTPDTSLKLGLGWNVPEAEQTGRPQGRTRLSAAGGGSGGGFQAESNHG